jgi:hypothetical protein
MRLLPLPLIGLMRICKNFATISALIVPLEMRLLINNTLLKIVQYWSREIYTVTRYSQEKVRGISLQHYLHGNPPRRIALAAVAAEMSNHNAVCLLIGGMTWRLLFDP